MRRMLRDTLKRNAPWAVAVWRKLRYRRLVAGDPADVFARIYRDNHWGDGESLSGAGSNQEATAAIRVALPAVLESLGKSVVDVPCGDFNWQREAIPSAMSYIGGDIVQKLIDRNRKKYPDRDFQVINLIQDRLPQADILLTRDCLVHLSLADGLAAVQNIRRSKIRYLVATTFVNRSFNEDIPTGAWRPLNMQVAPFNFPKPIGLVDERNGGRFNDKALGIWRIADL
jgi:hypothetical protein